MVKKPSGAAYRKLRAARGAPDTYFADRLRDNHAFLVEYKLQAGCADCGYREHHAALEFDHLEPRNGARTVATRIGNTRSRLLAEIAKCEVVCANCHRIRTFERTKKRAVE